jgi:ATP-dependent exoDNAse (exonuclease V) beta subunit
VGKIAQAGFEDAKALEAAAEDAENVRLLYVAATRARDLLVVPKPAWIASPDCWLSVAGLDELAGPLIPFEAAQALPAEVASEGAQDAETFQAEARRILEATPAIRWSAPSSHDGEDTKPRQTTAFEDDAIVQGGPLDRTEASVSAEPASSDTEASTSPAATPEPVAGRGRLRGLLLHALMEQLITGEVAEVGLGQRAAELTDLLFSSHDVALGRVEPGRPDPVEMANAARVAWNLPEIVAVRGDLLAEWNVYGHSDSGGLLELIAGVADAVAIDASGRPYLVIDWKSDVDPGKEVVAGYREQVRDYLRLTGVERGLLVFLTSGRVEEVRTAE